MGIFDFLKRKKEEEVLPEEPEPEEVKPLQLPTQPTPQLPPTPPQYTYPQPTYPQTETRYVKEGPSDFDKSIELIVTKLEVINAKLDRVIDLLSSRRY